MKLAFILIIGVIVGVVVAFFLASRVARKRNQKNLIRKGEKDQPRELPAEISGTLFRTLDENPKNEREEDTEYNDNYWFNVESLEREVSANLHLSYTTTGNKTDDRDFDVMSFSRGEKGYHIHGYCHKKNKRITLSSLGISDVVELETGREVDDIKEYLETKYKETDSYLQDLLFDEYGWAIYVLVYLASTSGSVVKREREVIGRFIKSLSKFSGLDADWVDAELKGLYRPGKMEIRKWVKEAIARGEDFTLTDAPIAELEGLQKPENKEFWTFKNYIQKQLNSSAG